VRTSLARRHIKSALGMTEPAKAGRRHTKHVRRDKN
jgi:hypothetical protein